MDDNWNIELTPAVIEQYVKKHGARNCTRIMSVLGKQQPFYEAIRTELGQEILKDVIIKLEQLLEKQINDNPKNPMTDQDKAEYRVYKELAENWSKRISLYTNKVKKLKRGK